MTFEYINVHIQTMNEAASLSSLLPTELSAIVANAAGCAPGEPLLNAEITDWYAVSAETTTVWLLKETTLIRLEISADTTLTITVPLRNIRRIVETTTQNTYIVNIELEADKSTILNETLDNGIIISRVVPSQYTLSEGIDSSQIARLTSFTRFLRASL